MLNSRAKNAFRAFMYGGGAVLLLIDLFFLLRAAFTVSYVPVVPIIAGIFTAGGLLFVVFAEHQARAEDKRDHRRISRVAHQLENPLHSLSDDFQHLLEQANSLPAETRFKIKRMETKTTTLLENIRDVFLMLQLQEGTVSQEQRTYDLCVLIKESVDHTRPLAAAQNVELTTTAKCTTAPVKVDRRLFSIALQHLLDNARTYTLKPGLVNVALLRDANKVRVIVQDRGIGIPAAERTSMWQPFARSERAGQFDADGIGVGLTLSRLIVQSFGGQLLYRPRPSTAGSQFEIVLPLAHR